MSNENNMSKMSDSYEKELGDKPYTEYATKKIQENMSKIRDKTKNTVDSSVKPK